jgi:MEDS: MEthanogen/methylotroph, DcmR Sensory domain
MSIGCSQGDHICALYENAQEQLSIAAAYVADGLRNDERCLYVDRSAAALERFRAALGAAGIDAERMAKRGALIESTSAEVHLAGGRFDSERMLRLLNDAVEAALDAGFKGLRTCGDMSWLLEEPEGADRIVEYEALLNQFFRGVRALGMCLYDRSRLPPAIVDHALATHSTVSVGGRSRTNAFYELPAAALVRTAQPERVAWKLEQLRKSS